jgi:phage shock protein A
LAPALPYKKMPKHLGGRYKMGIFSRFSEILNSNVNAMLDRAEDPRKMVKLMIHEMEETLMEIKSSAAEVVADKLRTERHLQREQAKEADWQHKAELAISKNHEELAREALVQKTASTHRVHDLQNKLAELDGLTNQYQMDIAQLEEKLMAARSRQQILIANHESARNRKRVEEKIYKLNTTGAFAKFEHYENKIDQFNAEAQILSVSNNSLEQKFRDLEHEDHISGELEKLKQKMGKSNASTENTALVPTVS